MRAFWFFSAILIGFFSCALPLKAGGELASHKNTKTNKRPQVKQKIAPTDIEISIKELEENYNNSTNLEQKKTGRRIGYDL